MLKKDSTKKTLFLGLLVSLALCSCKGELTSSAVSKSKSSPQPSSSSSASSGSTASSITTYRTIPAVVIVGKKESVLVAKAEVPVESYQAIAE